LKKKFELEENELTQLISYLDSIVKNKDYIVILRGDLASGKTTLVKNYVKAQGLNDLVTSPTFSLQSIYSDEIYHYDVYNKTLEEFISLGMLEEFEKEGIHFVEWGDKKLQEILTEYGYEVLVINIDKKENKRLYTIES